MSEKKKEAKEKPLDKMTVKELREIALQIPEITGVHGKNKPELLSVIKAVRGIVDDLPGKKDSSVREIKKKIRDLKKDRNATIESQDRKKAALLRRRISRLKKKTRKAA
ncbi:MAG: transcription termination factor Rho [Thermodesulfobacteriota bacterium]